MMQVSTIYAQSLERQLVNRRSQIAHNISRSISLDSSQERAPRKKVEVYNMSSSADDIHLSEAGLIPPELQIQDMDCTATHMGSTTSLPVEIDTKELSDRLCKLPSQCAKGAHVLGSPRRNNASSSNRSQTARLCQSTNNLNNNTSSSPGSSSPQLPIVRAVDKMEVRPESPSAMRGASQNSPKLISKKEKKKEAKKMPSNFMLSGTWAMKQRCEKMMEQVRSGDILEFNITLHHHWGIAIVPKNKKSNIDNVEIVHLHKDSNGSQRVVRQTLQDYWTDGVTARINNTKDLDKQPLPATDVAQTAAKLLVQPYKIWDNSGLMVAYCRYGDGECTQKRKTSDAQRTETEAIDSRSRWGTLSKVVGLWLTLKNTRISSPNTSPKARRKRTMSVNF